jgi:preprotein translocase subunit SecG
MNPKTKRTIFLSVLFFVGLLFFVFIGARNILSLREALAREYGRDGKGKGIATPKNQG